jgi:hypothetical protein
MFFSDRTVLIVDSAGRLIVTMIPPTGNVESTTRLGEALHSLEAISTEDAGGLRGKFKIVRTGTQQGAGAKVGFQHLSNIKY